MNDTGCYDAVIFVLLNSRTCIEERTEFEVAKLLHI